MAELQQRAISRSAIRFAVLLVAVIGVLYVVNAASSGESGGFRLRAETMLPENAPIWPDDVRCPDRQATSPVEFSAASALAYELPVYESELLFSRIILSPSRGPIPRRVTFEASWPADSVAADSPICAFLVADGAGASPGLTWRRVGSSTAEFVIDEPRPDGVTTIEVWLEARRPASGSVFGATLSAPEAGNDIVLEPLGGRVNIEARPGATVSAVMSSELQRVVGRNVQITLELPNPDPDGIALDTEFEVSAGPGLAWTVDAASAATCTTSSIVRCVVGDIQGGDSVTVMLEALLPSDWEPTTDPDCRTTDGRLQIGLCIVTDVSTAGAEAAVRSSLLIRAASAVDSPIIGELVPDPLIVRRSDLRPVTYVISAVGDDDLGSVEVTGTDCVELARVPQPLDDNDAFLEVGETWHYNCLLEATESRTFRLDLAALTESAEPLSTSIEGVLTVINPAMEVTTQVSSGEIDVTVVNTGDDPLSDLALVMTGCTQPPSTTESTAVLPVGSTITFTCSADGSPFDAPIAYALDSGGHPLSARSDSNQSSGTTDATSQP